MDYTKAAKELRTLREELFYLRPKAHGFKVWWDLCRGQIVKDAYGIPSVVFLNVLPNG